MALWGEKKKLLLIYKFPPIRRCLFAVLGPADEVNHLRVYITSSIDPQEHLVVLFFGE